MDTQNHKSRKRFRKWFKRKHKKYDPYQLSQVSDGGEDQSDDYLDEIVTQSMEMGSHTSTNELRIFVGTWNVAGRSPIGSLAVDLEEWLNLKDAADLYVLGFQEIVPLKTRTVIGTEDPTEARNWNLLIEKTLNNKHGSPWFTSISNPISSENYQYVDMPDPESTKSVSNHTGSPIVEQYEMPKGVSKYNLMASKKMVGVFISVWIKSELLRKFCISDVKVCSVACGIMGYLGNKGSVSVSMTIEGTSFCFVVAHLASGEKKGDEGRRNHQVSEIFRRTTFPRSPSIPTDNHISHPLTILGHDRIFWFGDLNYRLYLEDNLARQLINKLDWRALQEFDQLRREREYGGVFQGWEEGAIEFAPTYKYSSSNCNRYSGGLPSKSGEKQRTPAWCDRILWYGKGVTQLSYFRSESKFSDHRPVSALFSTQVEVEKSTNPRMVSLQTILPTITLPKATEQSNHADRTQSTLLSFLVEDIEASPTHKAKG
ncbi:putative phosphoric monoester hydrolase [Rosa chinensis]|uniref:Putative phosphoric monoester hydrolase n=1 Tax=Rosa chinensis TaxID=74649 RepID=A0A2P6S4W9_ROSCH|nr:type IV inositol polyphosphate 5-phosphatase 6 isoform X1 [Rosa chinensis]XP_024184426.1 type IV inositol polyphosphate 5-phosphatase 6 isoform X1 [Rosa chinensis]PRQ53733.1 putative phosphoric monoester hydrolase [Rosa chinensis]